MGCRRELSQGIRPIHPLALFFFCLLQSIPLCALPSALCSRRCDSLLPRCLAIVLRRQTSAKSHSRIPDKIRGYLHLPVLETTYLHDDPGYLWASEEGVEAKVPRALLEVLESYGHGPLYAIRGAQDTSHLLLVAPKWPTQTTVMPRQQSRTTRLITWKHVTSQWSRLIPCSAATFQTDPGCIRERQIS